MSIDMYYIFRKRYCQSLLVKGLQSYKLLNLEDDPIVLESLGWCGLTQTRQHNLFQTSNFKSLKIDVGEQTIWKSTQEF